MRKRCVICSRFYVKTRAKPQLTCSTECQRKQRNAQKRRYRASVSDKRRAWNQRAHLKAKALGKAWAKPAQHTREELNQINAEKRASAKHAKESALLARPCWRCGEALHSLHPSRRRHAECRRQGEIERLLTDKASGKLKTDPVLKLLRNAEYRARPDIKDRMRIYDAQPHVARKKQLRKRRERRSRAAEKAIVASRAAFKGGR